MPKTDKAALIAALDDIYVYWFGNLKSRTAVPADTKKWFFGGSQVDDEIRARFGAFIALATVARWDPARLTRRQQVALVVLLDQFPRNVFRGSGLSFASDAAARAVARKLIKGDHRRFFFVERMFLYLPLEHSEDVADQDLSVRLFAELAVEAPAALKGMFRSTLDYATRHRDTIRKFGRYPHRNKVLKRKTTAKERAFLKTTPGGF